MPSGGFDYMLISNKVKNIILKDLEADFFLQGKLLWTGYDVKFIPTKEKKRKWKKSMDIFKKPSGSLILL